MLDLWGLLVAGIFGSFWASIAGLTMLFYVMMMFSKVSQSTALNFSAIFIFSMSLGYGYTAISIIIWLGLLFLHLSAIPKMINSMQSG